MSPSFLKRFNQTFRDSKDVILNIERPLKNINAVALCTSCQDLIIFDSKMNTLTEEQNTFLDACKDLLQTFSLNLDQQKENVEQVRVRLEYFMILKNNTRHILTMRNFYSLVSNLVSLNSPDILDNEIIKEKIQHVADWI